MKGILRSVFDYGDIKQTELIANLQKLIPSRIDWTQPADKRLYNFAVQYFHQRLEVPSRETLTDYFELQKDLEVVERIKDLDSVKPYVRTNFQHLLHVTVEEQNKYRALALLKESAEIISKGLIIDKEKKQGLKEGVLHFTQNAHKLLLQEHAARIQGDILRDGQEVWDEYQAAKANKGLAWGKFCGINNIDKVVKGAKKGELWVHAAYSGELKTTYALNWAYNLVTRYRTNVYYTTLEMPYEQIRTQVYVMHSSNARFVDKGFAPLDYEKVKSGQLDADESEFYQLVIRDFNNNEEYGSFEVFCPDTDVSIDDIRVQAEISHNEHEIGLLVIDHGGLVEARKSKKGRDYVIELNSVIRDAKKLALHFNHGEKVPVLLLFQINREGKDYADKNEGRYKLRALAYANECVVEGTLVKTNVGLIPIEEVRPGEHRVWSSSGWKPVLHHFDQGLRQTYRTTTKNGLELVSTGSHTVRVLKEEALDWAEVSALKAGDFVLCDVGTRPFPELSQPLPAPNFLKYDEKAFGDDGRRIIFPEVFSNDLAYFLGVHAGDGSKVEGHIRITGNRKEVSLRDRVSSVFEGLFSQILNLSQSPSRPGSWDLGKQSVPLWRWCRRIGMDRGTNLHPNILRMTKVQTIHFLRGLWDADGSINTQGSLYLSQKASKKSMLQEVQLLMLDLGVESSLTTGWTRLKGKRYERVILTITDRKSRAVFATNIGFTEEHKQARLEFFVTSRQDSVKNTGGVVWPVGDTLALVVGRYIPEPSRKVRSALKKWGVSHHPISDGAFREVLSLTSSLSGDSDLDRLRALSLLRPYCVKSVEPCGEGKVYDLEVSGDHEYSTGGFLSHNCERSADLVSTTYLNEDHRREGTTVFDCLKRRDGPLFASFVAKIDWLTRRISNMEGLQGISDLGMTIDDARDLHDTSLEMFD